MCFIYHCKESGALLNDSFTHPTNIQHTSQKQRAKMDKVSLIKPIALSYTWSSGAFFGERGFCGRRFCIIIKMTQYPEKTARWPKSALATLIHVSHGDIKGSSLKRNDTSWKVICGEITKWAYTPVLSTQNPWSNDSKIWHGISRKDGEYRIENNRR